MSLRQQILTALHKADIKTHVISEHEIYVYGDDGTVWMMSGNEQQPVTKITDDLRKVLDTDVDTLPMSTRARNGLHIHGIWTLGELAAYKPLELIRLRYIGQQTVHEYGKILGKHSLRFGMIFDPPIRPRVLIG